MTSQDQKIEDLLRLAKCRTGNAHESYLAAQKAFQLAKQYQLSGQIIAHCYVTKNKAARRLLKENF